MLKQYSFTFFFCYWIGCLFAQFTSTDILISTMEDARLTSARIYNDRFRNTDMGTYFVDKVELRGRTQRWATMRHDITLRTTFNNFGERKAILDRHQKLADLKAHEWILLRKEILVDRYMQIIDAYHSERSIQHQQDVIDHYARLDSIYQGFLAGGNEIDLAKYLDNKENIILARYRLDELYSKRQAAFTLLGRDTSERMQFDDLIDLARMQEIVDRIQPLFEQTLRMRSIDLEYRYLDASAQLNKVQQNRVLNFIEGSYASRNDLFFADRYSIGIGLVAPWQGYGKNKKNSIILEKENLLLDQQIEKVNFQIDYTKAKADFDRQYALNNSFSATVNNDEIARLKDIIRKSGRIDLVALENLRHGESEIQFRQWEHYITLLQAYIKVLATTDTLSMTPIRNYLHQLTPILPIR